MKKKQHPYRLCWVSSGFTLLEMLCALSLSAVLLSIAQKIYLEMQQLSLQAFALGSCIDTGRHLTSFFRLKIHESGHFDCKPRVPIAEVWSQVVLGFTAGSPLPLHLRGLKAHTDVLSIKTCTEVEGKKRWASTYYYIADTGRRLKGNTVYSLFSKTEGSNRQELFGDVQHLQIKGVERSESAEPRTLRFDHIHNWEAIVGVEMTFTITDPQHRRTQPWSVDAMIPFRFSKIQ